LVGNEWMRVIVQTVIFSLSKEKCVAKRKRGRFMFATPRGFCKVTKISGKSPAIPSADRAGCGMVM